MFLDQPQRPEEEIAEQQQHGDEVGQEGRPEPGIDIRDDADDQ
jgi:hypothetical protein